MKKQVQAAMLVTLALATAGSAASGGVIIDDFEVGSIRLEKTEPSTSIEVSQTGLDPAKVLGGTRSLLFGQSGGVAQTLTIEADAGRMIYATVENGGDFSITYGSDDSPLNLDLRQDGASAFVLDLDTDEIISILRVGFASNGVFSQGYGVRNSNAVTQQPLPNGRTRVTIPFHVYNAREQEHLLDIDQIRVGAVRFGPNSRLVIHQFATIPEPSSGLLILIPTFSLGLARHRV